MTRRALAAAAIPLLLLLAGAPAHAETTGVVFTQGSTYVPGDTTGVVVVPLVQLAGHDLLFTNLDLLFAHTITSDGFRPDGVERLFESGPVNFRDQAVVAGVAELGPGTYGFFCSLHGAMRGAIDVVG